MTVPAFGLGTFRLKGQVVIDSVTNAIELGYRAIDTAQIYENEADVGQALLGVAVGDVMQHQHVDGRHVLDAGGGHAAHHPAREGMPRDDQTELEFRHLGRLRRDEVL